MALVIKTLLTVHSEASLDRNFQQRLCEFTLFMFVGFYCKEMGEGLKEYKSGALKR